MLLDKTRIENKSLFERNNDLIVENSQLITKCEELSDYNFNIQNQLTLLLQELDVVQAERDELIKRFIGNGFIPMSPRKGGSSLWIYYLFILMFIFILFCN